MITPANRTQSIEEYYFSKKRAEIAALEAQGANILHLGIGNPDFPAHPDVTQQLVQAASRPGSNYYQSYRGLPALRQAFAQWYNNIYHVGLNPETEILPLMGSKEAIMHIHMAFCNPGDKVLVPDPGYPTYAASARLMDLDIQYYSLTEKNAWLPDFEELERLAGDDCKLLWVNYPHMPSGKVADDETLVQLVDFARRKNILLVNDNPYSLILNNQAKSILSFCSRNDHVMELNSLSKSHNMAGWRVGMVAAGETLVNHIVRVKSNFDSGMFKPVQEAAIVALQLENNWYDQINREYTERRIILWQLLDLLGCSYEKDAAGLFVWARIPKGFQDGESFADYLLYRKGIFATPGSVFGRQSGQYIRFSLCAPQSVLHEGISRITNHQMNLSCA